MFKKEANYIERPRRLFVRVKQEGFSPPFRDFRELGGGGEKRLYTVSLHGTMALIRKAVSRQSPPFPSPNSPVRLAVSTVRTAAGTVVLASDNVYIYENLEKHVPIAATLNPESNLAAQDRMRNLASKESLIVPGHDAAKNASSTLGHFNQHFST
jgi:hypothetical protein